MLFVTGGVEAFVGCNVAVKVCESDEWGVMTAWGVSGMSGKENSTEDGRVATVSTGLENRTVSDIPSSISWLYAFSTVRRDIVIRCHRPGSAPLICNSPSMAARSSSAPRKPFWKLSASTVGVMRICGSRETSRWTSVGSCCEYIGGGRCSDMVVVEKQDGYWTSGVLNSYQFQKDDEPRVVVLKQP